MTAIHTLSWYGIWSWGAPEALLNYVSGLKIVAKYWTDFPIWGEANTWGLIGLTLISLWLSWDLIISRGQLKRWLQIILIAAGWFTIGITPVIFLPEHKYVLEQTLAGAGLAWWLAELSYGSRRWLVAALMVIYLATQWTNFIITDRSYPPVLRGQIARKVNAYFQNHLVDWPRSTYLLFTNDAPLVNSAWGASKQIEQALRDDEYFKVKYPGQDIKICYQDSVCPYQERTDLFVWPIGSRQFLYY